ncbi:hypothetical protein [Flavobacterium sp. 25HG05S-40]|uniref:hypothetical protein n=1 Tax=Flavobacterium sp. 25HG05S-40 TaxID=3458682 RepID=UPI004045066B
MEEEEAIAELKAMSKEELENVPFQTVWWICQAKGCCRGTKVRDYGIDPEYWDRRYSFFSINKRFLLCREHWKMYQRLLPNYDIEHIWRRMMEFPKKIIMTNEEKKAATPKRTRTIKPEMKRKK